MLLEKAEFSYLEYSLYRFTISKKAVYEPNPTI